jgi:outer membrane protein OmpA-like peptidoglycan-associated protein
MEKKQKILNAEQDVNHSLQQENTGLQKEITEKKSDLMVVQSISQSLAVENRGLENKVIEKQKELTAEEANSASLWNEKQNLESEKNKNDMLEKARSEFTKNEAEVYQKGNTLTVRLRGLSFPSAKSDLSRSNFPLLAKVQKVIKDFGSTDVIVEGHTDSIGGKIANNKISQDRAQTVRDYFISNGMLSEDKIKAIGYGENGPLASNKTAAGRAQNRRVDVIIKLDEPQKR